MAKHGTSESPTSQTPGYFLRDLDFKAKEAGPGLVAD